MMRVAKAIVWCVVVAVLAVPLSVEAKGKAKGKAKDQEKSGFKVSSPDLIAKTKISLKHVFKGFGCEGGNLSPALMWTGAPPDTKSFAITAYDPDAPTGSGWWHWVVYNIPGDTTELKTGAGSAETPQLPEGAAQGRTDFGVSGYGGPCPPQGPAHRYYFRLYALDTELHVKAGATRAQLERAMRGHVLAHAELMGRYRRTA